MDNFRINTPSLRPVRVSGGEDESVEIMIEYKGASKFSAFYKENRTDKEMHTIVEDVEIKINPEE